MIQSVICLLVWGLTQYQQYLRYLMATVHKSMFPGLFLTSTQPETDGPVVLLFP